MKTDNRECITKETIMADLLEDLKDERGECIFDTIYCAILLFFSVLFLSEPPFWRDIVSVSIYATVIIFIIAALVFLVFIWYKFISRQKSIKTGSFIIAEDTLDVISEDEFRQRSLPALRDRMRHHHRIVQIEDAFYFSQYGRVSVKKNVSAYSMQGDSFYLVILPQKETKILRIYSARLYRYENEY